MYLETSRGQIAASADERGLHPRSTFSVGARHLLNPWAIQTDMEVQMSTTPAAGSLPVASDPASSPGPSHQGNGSLAKSPGSNGDRTTSARTLSDLKDKIAGAQEVVKTKGFGEKSR
ncbi:hypothetical protein [Paraburkholderia sp. RL18-085-BIA-A]|jgi:hypothetical protein|uniref:hypothetical protein n=1 Tax=Paraburkholderia sp. RL18-085-BIA-A TaxID=3031633 RepID=UPI0038B852D3